MKYISTRGNYKEVSSARAIQLGMVPPGGLFVPREVPQFSREEIYKLQEDSYQEIAYKVLAKYLTDYTEEELKEAISLAYNGENFAVSEIASLVKLQKGEYILELWHGPTAAFKDMALQLMPQLLTKAVEKLGVEKEIVILVATSGDTGKAALEGFKDVVGTEIIVFYPKEGVSEIQKQQMVTTGGENTAVVAIEGNFDDCQSEVKQIFSDQEFREELDQSGYKFSSANSINWGRLVPQIIYYLATYSRLLSREEIKEGEKINITVPTGNFGNILAAYYATKMGLPANKLVCASNENKVLTDFLSTGVYDINREFKKTISPSMDILISSNLERFLFEITDHDAKKINKWYKELNEKGKFEVDKETKDKIRSLFAGYYADETDCLNTINKTYKNYEYVLDPHTAVGVNCYQQYKKEREETRPVVIASTASPYKFSPAVLKALLDADTASGDEFRIIEALEEKTGWDVHPALEGLKEGERKHNLQARRGEIKERIEEILQL